MKRSTVALVTAGLILGGAGVVEMLDTDISASAPVDSPTDRTVPAPVAGSTSGPQFGHPIDPIAIWSGTVP